MESKSLPVQERRPGATFTGIVPKALPGDPSEQSLGQDRLPWGEAHTEAHAGGCSDQRVWGDWGIAAARRTNTSTVNLWKTGVERTNPQRDLGIL